MLLIMVYASNDIVEWTVSYFFSNDRLLFWGNWVQRQGGVVLNQRFRKQASLEQIIKTKSYNKPYMKKKKKKSTNGRYFSSAARSYWIKA